MSIVSDVVLPAATVILLFSIPIASFAGGVGVASADSVGVGVASDAGSVLPNAAIVACVASITEASVPAPG